MKLGVKSSDVHSAGARLAIGGRLQRVLVRLPTLVLRVSNDYDQSN